LTLEVAACPATDVDASGAVDITELQRAMIAFLQGCP
jgi:hypothetical protein